MLREAVIFGAICGAAATLLTLAFLGAAAFGLWKLLHLLADAFTDVEPDEDLDTCKAIERLGVANRRNTRKDPA